MIFNMIHFLVIFVAQSFACHYSCLTCSGITENDCLTCSEGTTTNGKCNCSLGVYQNQICQSTCNQGYFQILDQCLECSEGCKSCQNDNTCLECYLNYFLTSSQICQPHCETGFYFLENNCVSLLLSVQVSTVVLQVFNSDIIQCEVEGSKFNFQSILPGNLCQFYNNYIIFGNDQIWNNRETSLYLSGLTYHQFIRIYFKAFFIDQWSNDDIMQIFIDGNKIFQYQLTGNIKQINTKVIDIKTNITHTKSDLTFTIKIPNQIKAGHLGISNLQIISDICGCKSCNVNYECVQQAECSQNQLRIDNICIDCSELQNRLFNCECYYGYYLNENENVCYVCDSQCQTCQYQSNYCTTCSANRIEPFTCSCNDGYYENNQGECQICSEQCLTCQEDSNVCITCSNSQFSPPKCECEFQIISNVETCFKCIKQEPSIELSAQFSFILITFDNNFTLFSQRCQFIFLYESFILFGENPFCKTTNNQIKVMLGKQFNYTKSNLLLLNKTNILIDNCIVNLDIISPYYKLSENKDQQLFLNYNFIQLTKNSSKTIAILTSLQKIFDLKWQIVYQKEEDENVINMINIWNSQFNSKKFEIFANNFNKNNNISLALQYQDFTHSENAQYLNIIVELDLDNKPELLVLTQISPIYENQQLIIKVSYEENQNILQNQLLKELNLNYSIFGKNLNLSEINKTMNLNDFFLISIENNLLKKGQLYQLFIEGNNNIFYYKTQMNFLILPIQSNLKIQGGSKQVSFYKDLLIRLTINNFEITEENNTFNSIIWSCRTLLFNNDCQNYLNQQIINVNNQTLLNIDKLSFEPYSVVEISIQAIQDDILYSDKVVYYFVIEDLPTLKIFTNNKVENQYNNDYNKIYFKLQLQNQQFEVDQYFYAGSIIYNYEILAFFQLFYPEFRIKLSDYYQLEQTGNQIYKFQATAPEFSIPSTATIQLQYKIFPRECQIHVLNNILQDYSNLFLIQVNQCRSDDQPLQFKFSIFIKSFKNKNQQNQIYISKFKYENKFKTILLNLLNVTSNVTINVDVLDRFLGLSSFNQTVILKPQNFTDQEFIKLKESFVDEEFFYQTNYFIQYLFANNLLYQSSIFNNILENMALDDMQGIKIHLQLINSFNSQIQQYPNQIINVFIEQQIEQLSSLMDRYNQPEQGSEYFSQFYVHEQIYFLFDVLNLLILRNNQDFQAARILKETSNNDNKSSNILQKNMNKIGEIVLKDQLPNENKISYNYNSFQLTTYKVTSKFFNNTQFQVNLMNNTFLSVKELKFNDKNMTQGLDQGKLKNTTYSIQTYDLKNQNNNSITEIQDGLFSYSFEIDEGNDGDYNYICMINIDENWKKDECEAVEQDNQIVCKCKKLALTTISQVLINFKTNMFYIFSEKNFSKISQQNYIQALFFYLQVSLTIFYIWFLFYGSKLDNKEQNIIDSSQQTKVYPSEKLTEAAIKKNLTLEVIDNILDVQQGNFSSKETVNSQMIYSPKETHRVLKDTVCSNEKLQSEISSPKSQISIANSKDQKSKYLFDNNRNLSKITETNSINSLNKMINENEYKTNFFLLIKFYKHYHKITALYFKFDQNQSRPFRGTLIYLSLLGQMSFINWFGEIYEPFTLVILSIMSYVFGLIYKKVLSCLLSNQIILFQYLGVFLSTLSAVFFIFVTISTIPLYRSIFTCNLWAVSFIVSVLIDLTFYTTLQIIFMFWVLMKFKQNTFFQKIIKNLLDPVCFTIIFTAS